MKERLFRMKQFSVAHSLSAMKVGMDAVMLGSWVHTSGSGRFLDAGTGCGIIALMLAQRAPDAFIDAIDIDPLSIIESKYNFNASPWSNRMHAFRKDFTELTGFYDLIVSNPPYFISGVDSNSSRRMKARHAGEFSPQILLTHGARLLNPDGKIALICPPELEVALLKTAMLSELCLTRKCSLRGAHNSKIKRIMLEFSKTPSSRPQISELIIEESRGVLTCESKQLTKDFYLD